MGKPLPSCHLTKKYIEKAYANGRIIWKFASTIEETAVESFRQTLWLDVISKKSAGFYDSKGISGEIWKTSKNKKKNTLLIGFKRTLS
jgi:hypothetical protein